MPTPANSFYLTSAHLICTEKTANHLTFVHFGNLRVYNTFQPNLTLSLLRQLKEPKKWKSLISEWDEPAAGNKSRIKAELEGLVSQGFILSFKSKNRLVRIARNPVLSHFVKHKSALSSLEELLSRTQIGVFDFVGVFGEVEQTLRSVGLERVSRLEPELKSKDKLFAKKCDYFIAVGDSSHRLFFSKINQFLLPLEKPWLLVTLDAFGGTLGPTFGNAGGPCFDCIVDQSKRYFGHGHRESQYLDLIENRGEATLDYSNHFMAKGIFFHVGIESVKTLSRILRPWSYDGFFTFDFLNARMDFVNAGPSPVCPVCSDLPR